MIYFVGFACKYFWLGTSYFLQLCAILLDEVFLQENCHTISSEVKQVKNIFEKIHSFGFLWKKYVGY